MFSVNFDKNWQFLYKKILSHAENFQIQKIKISYSRIFFEFRRFVFKIRNISRSRPIVVTWSKLNYFIQGQWSLQKTFSHKFRAFWLVDQSESLKESFLAGQAILQTSRSWNVPHDRKQVEIDRKLVIFDRIKIDRKWIGKFKKRYFVEKLLP